MNNINEKWQKKEKKNITLKLEYLLKIDFSLCLIYLKFFKSKLNFWCICAQINPISAKMKEKKYNFPSSLAFLAHAHKCKHCTAKKRKKNVKVIPKLTSKKEVKKKK